MTMRVAEQLKLANDNVFGCDVSRRASSYSFRFVDFDGRSLKAFSDGSVDLIMALNTLHHAKSLDDLLDEARRVLAPSGVFLIQEHDCDGPCTDLVLHHVHYMWKAVKLARKRMKATVDCKALSTASSETSFSLPNSSAASSGSESTVVETKKPSAFSGG